MDIGIFILLALSVVLLWLNFLASFAIKYDATLERIQTIGQLLFVWLVPYFGAAFILKLVFEHSPKAIPKAFIPWPFRKIIFGTPIRNQDGAGGVDVSSYVSNRDSHGSSDGGGGGGGGE